MYRTPALNDKLFANFKGFAEIAGLEEYTGLRALFLEGNAIDMITGLSACTELRCLWVGPRNGMCPLHVQPAITLALPSLCRYLQKNCLTEVAGLEALQQLDTLNISDNHISNLDGVACLPQLHTLLCTNNKLSTVESVAHLVSCTALTTLDLQGNQISDPAILDVLRQMTELRCLYLKGNPVVSTIRNYRKSLIAALPQLKYLDERPVFDDERRIVMAW